MPPNDPSPTQVYQELLTALSKAGASQLAEEIRRTVARGVVLTGQETELYQSSTVYREMNESEALAIALEFFVTALEVPLMITVCKQEFGGESIGWRLERPGSEREEIAFVKPQTLDQGTLMPLLKEIIDIANKLSINLPEVA
jgi:hypothetical protein